MAVFEYVALSKATGKKTRGVIDADNTAAARQKLREQELYPTSIVEASSKGAGGANGRTKDGGKEKRAREFHIGSGVGTRDLALMTRQLSVLLHAGMPMVEALSALNEQTARPRLRTILYDVRDKVNSGGSFADALENHPKVFSALYINMVRAGEVSGTLEPVLFRLTDILEHNAKMKSQITSSLAYPVFMAIFAVSVIVGLLVFIVPRITIIFERQGKELPVLTQALLNVSAFISGYWWAILAGFALLYFLWRMYTRGEEGRKRWDRFRLRIPLYGNLHLKLVCARFSRTLGTMLQSGLTMMRALEVVITVLDNTYIREKMNDVKAGVRRGRDLAVPMRETGLFPSMMLHMIDLGQRSGEIEEMLIKVAETYDDDVRLTVDALIALLEPVIIVIMGVFVGVLVLAILLPILNMSTNIQ